MLISEAASKIGGELVGADVRFTSASIDTRTIKKGDLFIALRGPNFDGHEYLDVAKEQGAVAALVSKPVKSDLPTITVKDTRASLGMLSAIWRDQFQLSSVAITGSCGKTTVKEMVASILSLQGNTHYTKGNFNNDIGVPLTLLDLSEQHQYAVIELGANHLGEIAYTVELAQPDVAVITNAGEAHIEGFGSKDNVAKAKGEIFQGLSAQGVAVLNKDDDYYEYWQTLVTDSQQASFSLDAKNADYFGSDFIVNAKGQYCFVLNVNGDKESKESSSIEIALPLLGRFSVLNAIASAAVAYSVGASLENIKKGLEGIKPIRGRLYPESVSGYHIIDDSYNANPISIRAAIDLLSEVPGANCLVLGDMGELGVHSPSLHREVGSYAAESGIELLLVKGKYASDYLVGFTTHKSEAQRGVGLDTHAEIVRFIMDEVSDSTILIKGSRSASMEKVIEILKQHNDSEGQG